MTNDATGTWHDGYVVDVPYIEPITADLCPARFSMAAVLHGQPPIDHSRPLTWVELGSGSGLSACMVAAANTNIEVWGCDFNPAHVERSRRLAAKAALSNCTFDEASFEQLAANELVGPAEADVVVVHGVYSWVSRANQGHIAEFIRRRLRPGGLVYVSYELATGWSSMTPLAEAMRLHAQADGRRSDLAFPDAARAIQRLADGGARYFPLGSRETFQMSSLVNADARYAAHEYLGGHFRPVMFDEVADMMAAARCSYVGSLDAADHMTGLWVQPELTDLVVSTADVTLQQMLRDVIVQRPLRRDLFRRGLATSTDVEREAWLRDLVVVGLGLDYVDGAVVDVPVGEVALDPSFYKPLVDALADAPINVSTVQSVLPNLGLPDAVAAMSLLVGGSYAAPAVTEWNTTDAGVTARRLNEVLIAENRAGADHRCLIAPATGAALASEYFEMLGIGALWNGVSVDVDLLTDHVLAELDAQQRFVLEQDAVVENRQEARDIVGRRIARTLQRTEGPLTLLGIW